MQSPTFREAVQAALPELATREIPETDAPQVLVAGCGTGLETLRVTSTYRNASILAVDLSGASLGYAMRKSREYGIEVEHLQADILDLTALSQRFDLIDSFGVIHHMAEPVRGLKVLSGLLKPQGLIFLGLYSEIGRILSHLLNLTTQAMDVGALTPPLWGFEEREKLMVFYERACGARMHANYFRPGGVGRDLPDQLVEDIGAFCDPFLKVCDDLEELFIGNRIFKQRNVDIGVISLEDAWKWGFSGVMVRGSGAAWDLRKSQPYECYEEMDFDIPIGKHGDCYDRAVIRMEEMRQSTSIMRQCVEKLDRKSTRLNSSHTDISRMPSSA